MDKIIGCNLRKLREAAQYTQEEMATALKIKRSAYSNYEAGEREIPYDVIEKASDLFGIDMALLFEENPNIDTEIMVAAFRIDGLNPEDTEEILHFKDIVKSYLKMERIEAR